MQSSYFLIQACFMDGPTQNQPRIIGCQRYTLFIRNNIFLLRICAVCLFMQQHQECQLAWFGAVF